MNSNQSPTTTTLSHRVQHPSGCDWEQLSCTQPQHTVCEQTEAQAVIGSSFPEHSLWLGAASLNTALAMVTDSTSAMTKSNSMNTVRNATVTASIEAVFRNSSLAHCRNNVNYIWCMGSREEWAEHTRKSQVFNTLIIDYLKVKHSSFRHIKTHRYLINIIEQFLTDLS